MTDTYTIFFKVCIRQVTGNLSVRQSVNQASVNQTDIGRVLIRYPKSLEEQKRIVAILDEAFEGLDRAAANAKKNLANARELFDSHLNAVFRQKGPEWRQVLLEDACERINVGHVGPMASKYVDDGIPFLRSQNIRPFQIAFEGLKFIDTAFNAALRKSELRPGDVAVVRTGYPGTAAVIPESLELANCADLVIASPKASLNPHFLAMFFNSAYGKSVVLGNLTGAAQKHFNINAARQVLMPLPSPTEQNPSLRKYRTFFKAPLTWKQSIGASLVYSPT